MSSDSKVSGKQNIGLILAIVFSALIISGGLVFLGLRMSDKKALTAEELDASILKGIESYVENEQKKAQEARAEAEKPKFVEGDFTDDDPFIGDKDAPVTIVEFSDYQCPYCASFVNETLPKIKEKYIDTGKVRLVYRDYPLSFHPDAQPAALFAECVDELADDSAYFKVHDEIFKTIAGGFNFDKMSKFANGLGVDQVKLKKCFDANEFKAEIEADEKAGEAVGISGTPGFIVNGWVISGAQPFSKFAPVIERELAKKQ